MEVEITLDALPSLMSDAKAMAQRLLSRESRAHTVQPTGLVNSALVSLSKGNWENLTWENRDHFFGSLFLTMQNILRRRARKRNAKKRRLIKTIQVDDKVLYTMYREPDSNPELVEVLCEVLDELAQVQPQWRLLILYKYWAQLTLEQCAAMLELSVSTVQRDLARAQAALLREIKARIEPAEKSA